MKKSLLRILVAVLVLTMTFSVVITAGAQEKQSITVRIGSGHSMSNPWVQALEDFFIKNVSERVEAETNYTINWVESFGGSTITLRNELEGVQMGLVDIGCIILVFEASRLPLQTMVYSMPFSCSDPLIVAKVYQQMEQEFPEFATDYATKYNQQLLGMGVSDQYGLYSTKPITSLADMAGMKIGAAGVNLTWIEGSGAIGVQTSLNDTYQNLQTSVCGATIQPTHSCLNLKVYEVAPYYLDANLNVVPFNAITANLDSWNSWPEEVKAIMTEVGSQYLAYESEYISQVHAQDLQFMQENGVQVDTLDREAQVAWAASLNDVVAAQIKLLNDAGYRGNEIVARYYELLKENGVEPVREWNLN